MPCSLGFSTARVISRVTRIEIIMPPLHIVHSVGPAHDHSPSGADGRNSDPVFGTERDRLNCNIFDNERGGRNPAPADGTEKPGAFPASRPKCVSESNLLLGAATTTDWKDHLKRIGENRDGHGGMIGTSVRSPHPVIL